MSKRYSKELIKEIKEEFKTSSLSIRQLSEKYEIPHATIGRWVHNSHKIIRQDKAKAKAKAIELYQNTDLTMKEVSEAVNVKLGTVGCWLTGLRVKESKGAKGAKNNNLKLITYEQKEIIKEQKEIIKLLKNEIERLSNR